MENLEVSLEKAHFDYKHAENSTLLLTYLCQQENIRKILETKESASKAFSVFEKCTKIAYDHVLKSIEEKCGNSTSEEKKCDHDHASEIENLSKACN